MPQIKSNPTWEGIPAELRREIISKMNVLDRSVIRYVTFTDGFFADSFPYHIDTLDIFTTATELYVNIKETIRPAYSIPKSHRLPNFMCLMKSRGLRIEKLNISCDRHGFGAQLQTIVEAMKGSGILKNSLLINEIIFYSVEMTWTTDILEMLEFCQAEVLTKISIKTTLTDQVLADICNTEQWNKADEITLSYLPNLTWCNPFDNWAGSYLQINTPVPVHITDAGIEKIAELYRKKSGRAKFLIGDARWIGIGPSVHYAKRTAQKSLLEVYSVNGFVSGLVYPIPAKDFDFNHDRFNLLY
ncbi:hypothetical protein GCK72_021877 [Caenorhabditis remanei]|uniref:DUF38 domain-containing protein n=1 Tax=Caenorhabditis remanei TaxID=31234 RepID=A0A6A5GJA6_CAERE|nr:hypothetical protein GCK72_021877 [Caenorhabditis remanei]KAF1755308.1 hypothetical protein GCK72_021877 [Caenorhabditis remanei]